MNNTSKRPTGALEVEALEQRELLSASTVKLLNREAFDSTLAGTLTPGWAQWSSHGSINVTTQGQDRTRGLITEGASGQKARTWLNTSQQANIQVGASVYLNSLVPMLLFARGSDLSSYAPNYYAVRIERGLGLKLVRVVDGVETTLAQIRSQNYFSNRWGRVTLRVRDINVSGQPRRQVLEALLQRTDTGEYLDNSGRWRKNASTALTATDTSSAALRTGGQVGFARNEGYPGTVTLDNFKVNALDVRGTVGATTYNQTFNGATTGTLPRDWSQWDDEGQFQATQSDSLSRQTGMQANGGRLQEARAWMDTPAPADVEVSSAIHLISPASGQVLLRGSNLTSNSPSYYAVRIHRGIEVELLRVKDGASTRLGILRSSQYVSDPWIQVTLTAVGRALQVRIKRLDTNQYLNSSGKWQK